MRVRFLNRNGEVNGLASPATEDAEPSGERGLKFHVPLSRIMHPLEYRVSAGGNSSDTYKVQVLYLTENPQKNAIIDRGKWNWIVPIALMGFGVLCLWLAWYTRQQGKKV